MEGNIDLPELMMRPVKCLMPSKQGDLYRAVVDYVLYTLKEKDGAVYPSKLKMKFMLLCMALHDPGLLARGSLSKVDQLNDTIVKKAEKWKIEENGKYEVALSLLEKYVVEEQRKVILWSGHPYIIDTLAEKLAKYKPFKLHGAMESEGKETVAERNARVCAEFLSSRSPLMIANYQVLTTSVNLTAVTRNVYWDVPLRQDVLFQTIKRSHRIGTTEPVIANFLLFSGTVEENLYNGLMDKNDFNEKTWSRSAPLTVVELKNLFNGGK
jgi:SNF2 family DNA or RNA helicase